MKFFIIYTAFFFIGVWVAIGTINSNRENNSKKEIDDSITPDIIVKGSLFNSKEEQLSAQLGAAQRKIK